MEKVEVKTRLLFSVASMIVGGFGIGLPFYAAAEESKPTAGLEEIVVTATRREESLQSAPVAVSVFGAEEIREKQIVGLNAIGLRVPGFAISQPNRNTTSFALRGAGTIEDSPGWDQPTALFVDDVYVGQTSAVELDYFDIDRIEVLRGPQGTLYGKNVVGGAVNIVTRKPSFDPYALFEVTGGKYGRFDANGVVSGALVDDVLAGQVAFSMRTSNGYARNLVTGDKAEAENTRSARGQLRLNPNPGVDVTLAFQYSKDKSTGIERALRGDDLSFVDVPKDGEIVTNVDGHYDREMWGLSLRGQFATPAGQLTSVTAYRSSENNFFDGDVDGTPLTLVHFLYQLDNIKQFSQELRLAGDSGPLRWVAGLYYLNVDQSRDESVQISGAPGSLASIVLTGLMGENGAVERFGQSIETNSYAAFGQIDYALTPTFTVTAGARYTKEKKQGDTYCAGLGLQCRELYSVDIGHSWEAFTPRFGIEFTPREDLMFYASASRGFKSGGFITGYPTAAGVEQPFSPEYAWSYEAGVKSRWLNNRLQINLALFHTDYDNLQVRNLDGTGQLIAGNAGSARARGLELEVVTVPAEGLNLYATYGYLSAKYRDFVLEGEDYSGNRMALAPKHSFSTGASYEWDLANLGSLAADLNYQYKSLAYFLPSNDPSSADNLSGVLNGSLNYRLPGERWSVQLWAQNLLDNRDFVQATNFGFFYQNAGDFLSGARSTVAGRLTPPRTYGVTVRWSL